MLLAAVLVVFCVCLVSLWVGPFLCVSTYFRLWRHVLLDTISLVPLRLRIQNSLVLARYFLLNPVWTLAWFVDEILFPSYRKEQIEKPIIILGQPRSGTTFLHRTLAADETNFLGVRHMEWRFPFLFMHLLLRRLKLEHYLAGISYWPKSLHGTLASKMHPHYLGSHEEDGIFFEERFLQHYFVFRRFPYPGMVPMLHSFSRLSEKEQSRILSAHRKVLQKVCYLNGDKCQRILLKENESYQMLSWFRRTYPDAIFVAITRPSRDFLNSYMSLSLESTLSKTAVNPLAIPGWKEMNLWKRREDCLSQVRVFEEMLDCDEGIAIDFDLLLNDITGSVMTLYQDLNLTAPSGYLTKLNELEQNQRHRVRGYGVPQFVREGFDFFDEFSSRVRQQHKRRLEARVVDANIRASASP